MKIVDRDEVLFAFHQTCTDPTAEQIIEWVERFPQFADDIRAHAAILKDWAADEDRAGAIKRLDKRNMDWVNSDQ